MYSVLMGWRMITFVDVIELAPVVILHPPLPGPGAKRTHVESVLDQGLILRPAGDGHVEGLGGEEGLEVEEVEVVVVEEVGEEGTGHPVDVIVVTSVKAC